jgi:hypothetical protein
MLEDWRGMDKEKAKEYIINCQVCIASALLLAVFFLAFILDSCKLWLLVHINSNSSDAVLSVI